MFSKPQQQHDWLHRMIGNWTSEFECQMGPDEPPSIMKGTETVRSLGGLWTIGEGTGEIPGGGTSQSIMSLGFDPEQNNFVGTFISSVMTHLWQYKGSLDAAGKVLTLDTEGPNFVDGGITQYKDIITLVDNDHRILTSQFLTKDGTWNQFMTGHYHRLK